MTALWAFLGGLIGGVLVSTYYEIKLANLHRVIAAQVNGLVAHHDAIVTGLIERIKSGDAALKGCSAELQKTVGELADCYAARRPL